MHAPAGPRITLTTPLARRDFRTFWIALVISQLGSLIQTVGASWMMATTTQSDTMVALVQTAANLPLMMFSYVCGVVADTFERRKVLLTAQIFSCVVAATL